MNEVPQITARRISSVSALALLFVEFGIVGIRFARAKIDNRILISNAGFEIILQITFQKSRALPYIVIISPA
jgi:hypothetical protein